MNFSMPNTTVDIDKKMKDILTMDEALMTSMAAAEAGRKAGHIPENTEFSCFMSGVNWVLCDLSKAALKDHLLARLVELQGQFDRIAHGFDLDD